MKINALSQLQAKHAPKGKYADGQGLWLWKNRKETGRWKLRIVVNGKRREMGLGRWPDVSIAEAREQAATARKQVRNGIDPINARQAERRQANALTITDAINGCFKARQAELKGDGTAGRWLSPLSNHIIPKIGHTAIEALDQHLLKETLEPIWHEKPDTARKALNRLNLTLQYAAALGLEVDLQAAMKTRALLGKQRHTAKHIPSLPYQEAPAFYRLLTTKDQMSCLALRFLMLTVARTSEIRFATYAEIDDNIWIIPADRTKTGQEHRVPLTTEARGVIEQARTQPDQTLLFPAPSGKPLSDAAMAKFMKDQGMEARPHGFRSTFRTWAEETTDASYEVKEACLGHTIGSEVERAYQRSDLLKKRLVLMEAWGAFLIKL